MKKKDRGVIVADDHDTMRPEYDFADAVRGVTAARYAEGANVAIIAPDILDVLGLRSRP